MACDVNTNWLYIFMDVYCTLEVTGSRRLNESTGLEIMDQVAKRGNGKRN